MTMSLIAGVAAFVLTVLAMPHFITYYKIKKIGGQQMHEDVKQHLAKAGTPTMGGTVFLVVAILVSLIFNFHVFSEGHQAYGATAGILFVILIYGIIGFLDDFLKIFRQINEGLKPWQKMALQIIAGLLFYFIHVLPSGTDSLVIGGLTIHLGVFYVLFVLFWLVVKDEEAKKSTNHSDNDSQDSGLTLDKSDNPIGNQADNHRDRS